MGILYPQNLLINRGKRSDRMFEFLVLSPQTGMRRGGHRNLRNLVNVNRKFECSLPIDGRL